MNETKKRRFNVIDVIVIVVLIAAIVFAAVRFFGSRNVGENARTITYEVTVEAVPVGVYEGVAALLPDQMMSNGSMQSGTVQSVRAEPCEIDKIEYTNPQNAGITYELPAGEGYVRLIFTCTAAPDSPVTNKLGSQEIRLGKEHIVKTTHFELTGYVSSVVENG